MICDHSGAAEIYRGRTIMIMNCPQCELLNVWRHTRAPERPGWIEGQWLPLSHFRGPSHKSNCHHTPPGQD